MIQNFTAIRDIEADIPYIVSMNIKGKSNRLFDSAVFKSDASAH